MNENEERLFQDWFKTGRYVLGPVEHPIEDRNHSIQFKGGAYVELIHEVDYRLGRPRRYMVMVTNYGEFFDDLESAARFLFEEFARYETDFR